MKIHLNGYVSVIIIVVAMSLGMLIMWRHADQSKTAIEERIKAVEVAVVDRVLTDIKKEYAVKPEHLLDELLKQREMIKRLLDHNPQLYVPPETEREINQPPPELRGSDRPGDER